MLRQNADGRLSSKHTVTQPINKAVDSVTLNIIATHPEVPQPHGRAAAMAYRSVYFFAGQSAEYEEAASTRKAGGTIENCFFSPTWWESQSPSTQDLLTKCLKRSIRPFATLTDDGRRDAWTLRCFAPTAAS
jgi:hypothetical protein